MMGKKIRSRLGHLRRELSARHRRGGELSVQEHGRLWLPTIAKNGGIGVELGVAAGYYSAVILQNSPLSQLYSIDCWGDHHDSAEYLECCRRLRPYGERSIVLRMYFEEAVCLFEDAFFDFVYVDAYAGSGQDDGRVLKMWWPKIKPGGVFGGHDYDDKWPATVKAVNEFCSSVDRVARKIPGVTSNNKHDGYASWSIIK